jgi:hypothetical protein
VNGTPLITVVLLLGFGEDDGLGARDLAGAGAGVGAGAVSVVGVGEVSLIVEGYEAGYS